MKSKTHLIEGRECLTLEAVAELYSVELIWVEQLVSRGLVGEELKREGRLWVEVRHLGRIATAVRLCHGYGLDLEAARKELDALQPADERNRPC